MQVPRRRVLNVALPVCVALSATALSWLLTRPPMPLAAAERLFQAATFHLAAPFRPPHPRIVLIGIDDATLDGFPYRSPVDRGFLAGLVDRLAKAEVAAIGLDLLFDQPTEPAKDAALQAAMRNSAAPVVALSVGPETPLSPPRAAFLAEFLSGVRTGTGNLAREVFDDTVRMHVPVHPVTGAPSFPVSIARALGVPTPQEPFPIAWRRTTEGSVAAVYPANAVGLMPAEWLRGRVALVGGLQPGVDEHRTQASAFVPRSFGVEIHAQVLAQLLDGRARPGDAGWRELLFVAGLAAAGVAAGMLLTGRRLLLALGGIALAWLVVAVMAVRLGDPPWPALPPVRP